MIPPGEAHVCRTLRHRCEWHTGGDVNKWLFLCCRYCPTKCDRECFNEPARCNVHAVIDVPGKVRINSHIKKNVVVVDTKTGDIIATYNSIAEAIMEHYGTRKAYDKAMKNGEIAITQEEGQKDAKRFD